MVRPIEQNVQRDLVRRFLPLGAFDQLDHAVEERRAGRGRDADHDAVGNDGGAAGHRRAVAAGFADDRRGFAGNGGFVDRGDALDHVAVAGDDVAGLAYHKIAGLQVFGRYPLIDLVVVRHQNALGARLGAGLAQGVGLRPPAPFRHRFGEIRKQHGEPQPQNDLEGEAEAGVVLDQVAHEQHGGQRGDDFEHEDHRILDQSGRVELGESLADRRQHDLGIDQRRDRHPLAQFRSVHCRNSE